MIFLYSFDIQGDGMDFVLNEKIGEDMMKYCPEYEEMLRPLVASLCDVLKRYKFDSKSDTIMTGRILDNNEFEVMLSEGLGDIIDPYTKKQAQKPLPMF